MKRCIALAAILNLCFLTGLAQAAITKTYKISVTVPALISAPVELAQNTVQNSVQALPDSNEWEIRTDKRIRNNQRVLLKTIVPR